MEIQLPIAELRPGMYIVDLEGRQGVDASVFSVEGFVLSPQDVVFMHSSGFRTAFVDPGRSRLPGELQPDQSPSEFHLLSTDAPGPPRAAYREEYGRAEELHNASHAVIRSTASSVLAGKPLPLDEIREFLSGLVQSVVRNGQALLAVSRLRQEEDPIFTHSLNVAILGVALARQMGMQDACLPDMALAGFLHDVGKLFVPSEILHHPGTLGPEQMAAVQEHAARGHVYLRNQPGLPRMVLDGAEDHHERYDGSGYPAGKARSHISFTGRLLAVVDVYDAVSSARAHRAPLSPAQALAMMYDERAGNYTPGFLHMLSATLGAYPPGSLVSLSNSLIAVVVEASDAKPDSPKVVAMADTKGGRIRPRLIDLAAMPGVHITGPVLRPPASIDPFEAIKQAI